MFFSFLTDHLAEKYVEKPLKGKKKKKAISGELSWSPPITFYAPVHSHKLPMLSLGGCLYGPMWMLGAALHSWGDASQKAKKSPSAAQKMEASNCYTLMSSVSRLK